MIENDPQVHGIMRGRGLICAERELWQSQRKFVTDFLRESGLTGNYGSNRSGSGSNGGSSGSGSGSGSGSVNGDVGGGGGCGSTAKRMELVVLSAVDSLLKGVKH